MQVAAAHQQLTPEAALRLQPPVGFATVVVAAVSRCAERQRQQQQGISLRWGRQMRPALGCWGLQTVRPGSQKAKWAVPRSGERPGLSSMRRHADQGLLLRSNCGPAPPHLQKCIAQVVWRGRQRQRRPPAAESRGLRRPTCRRADRILGWWVFTARLEARLRRVCAWVCRPGDSCWCVCAAGCLPCPSPDVG